jgi:bifunctional DNase/RNase
LEGFREVIVDSIRVHMATGQHVVILKEKDANRYLPIWIGLSEANAIALRITGVKPERPMTHDLLATLLKTTNTEVKRVMVTSLANEIFYARIVLNTDSKEVDIDARPSDAIALAVRCDAPIYVADEVMEKAGIVPEEEEAEKTSDEGLDAFKNLMSNLDLPDLPDEPEFPKNP